MGKAKPVLGITMGDPAGVGPEIIAAALTTPAIYASCEPYVIGEAGVMQAACRVMNAAIDVIGVESIDAVEPSAGKMIVLNEGSVDMDSFTPGEISPRAGQAAYAYVARATALALEGKLDGIVTAPLNKAALNAAGHAFSGHTEILANLCGVEDVAMMLVAGGLHVSHVSTHCSLAEACSRVKTARVVRVITLTAEALREMGCSSPRIAVAGLNPHAGEGGLFGREEIDQIVPAIDIARAKGMDVFGPEPPDTIFLRALTKTDEIQAVVAMYHDQGHIAVKMADFFGGVNLTLGLPILRTSVDHGTAFDIAWQGKASPDSMLAALELAARMAVHRKH